ncbi:hypothetical protein Stsp01_01680 [Streptomyces sp. NBRC 13847]|nr:hypothetical protein Stsp01_01680 [Streptomyces sp. NBRC 13847]
MAARTDVGIPVFTCSWEPPGWDSRAAQAAYFGPKAWSLPGHWTLAPDPDDFKAQPRWSRPDAEPDTSLLPERVHLTWPPQPAPPAAGGPPLSLRATPTARRSYRPVFRLRPAAFRMPNASLRPRSGA